MSRTWHKKKLERWVEANVNKRHNAYTNADRNHGGCSWCEENRTYSTVHQLPADELEQIEEGYNLEM
jgi:hypothetical protein